MASTLESPNTQQYVDFDEYIEYQLERTRGNIKTTDILTAFAFVAVFVLAYLLLFVIGDHWLVEGGFSQTTRIVLLSIVGVVSVVWLAWKVLWPYLRKVNALFAAQAIEKSQPELRSTLLNLIDARSAGKDLSPAILSAMEKRAAVSISQSNVDEAVDRRPLMWASYAVLGLVLLLTLYALFTPKKVSASLWRALFPTAAVEAPTETVIENVSPGDVEVLPGTRLEVLADISGQVPEKIMLYYTTRDHEFVNEPIEMREVPDMPRRYRAVIIGTNGQGIQQDLNYSIQAGDDRSARYAVTVFQPPTADIIELHYAYPGYMGRQPKTRTTGNIDDYEGVIVTFLAEGNMPLKSATITFHDDQGTNYRAEAIPMQAINEQRTRFRARWVLSIREDDGIYPRYYTIECKNERGVSDPNPTRWPIRIHPDQRPEAKILNPQERELERPANAILPVTAFASDDFKVRSLTLWKQLNEEKPVPHRVLFEGAEASLSVDYDWKLNENWPLKAGDKVSYWVQAEDNREPEPGKRNSDKYTILIQPEQPEELVQQQLESDRPDQPKPQENDPSQKNPDEMPQNNNPRPEQGTEQEQSQENQSQQGEPQQGEPQEGQENQTGEQQGGGEASQSEPQNGSEGSQGVKNDGSQDGKALESLHQHYNDNPPEPGQENQTPQNQEQSPENQPGDPGNDPSQPNPEQQPNGKEPQPETGNSPENTQPENASQPKPDEKTTQPENAETGPQENQPGQKPMPGSQENAPMENPEQPGGEATENPPGQNNKTENGNTPKTEQQPDPNAPPPEPMTPEGQEAPGGSDQNAGQGKPSGSNDPKAQDPNKATGGNEALPNDGGQGPDAEQPLENGTPKPADPDPNAQQREATGEEKGPATTGDDPNADATPAENRLERTDPEKPATTRNREGDPNEATPDQATKQPGEENSQTPNAVQPGSEKPKAVDPQKPAKPNTNPDQNADRSPENDPMRQPAQTEDQPNAGDDELKGEGRPEGQEAKKPDGGEAGSSKQQREGTPGGNEKGPGDQTPRPGETDSSEKPNGGRSSDESGEGSRTRSTDRTEQAPPREGMPREGSEPTQTPKDQQPAEEPQPTDSERKTDQPAAQNQPGQAGPPNFDPGRQGEGPMPSAPPPTPESEPDLEAARQATDLALKRLEDQLERGDVDEKWLKEMGWDEADAAQFLDRMKDRLNNRNADTPEARAQQKQFNNWLKQLNKPAGQPARRTGSAVRNRAARDVFNTRRAAPPAELRDIYEAYQRGVSERSQ